MQKRRDCGARQQKQHGANSWGATELAPLPADTLGVRVALAGQERYSVADCVPPGRVAAVVRHLQEHASPTVAAALGAVICRTGDCAFARALLLQPVCPLPVVSTA